MKFHIRCGDRVTLLNENSTAVRNFVEFNHGLILSAAPLKDDVLFEVCIERKVNVWNGSLEIGVTTLDPELIELPATATKLRNTAWIMSGSSILKDGVTLVNSYGPELDTLREGDYVGVVRTKKAELMFYINGRGLGVAARDMPPRLFAVIDLYGQCVQVSIKKSNGVRPILESCLNQIEGDPSNDDTLTSSDMGVVGLSPAPTYPKPNQEVMIPMMADIACALVPQDRLRFHPRCGILVKLSNNNKSAERERPLDDYNNGVVMTHRPLYDNELFEIRIDVLVDKWSGSIEVGVTTHNPANIRFPSTMTNMDSGTIMMSGCKVLLNGHGTCMEYGNFNLDELREGDTVGMMRKSSGKLHYFINGVDQGVATDKVEQQVWGVIDLYGMTVKVTIVDPCEDIDSNIHVNNMSMLPEPSLPAPSNARPTINEDSLLFHTLRDSNVIIINGGKTAHRPNAFEYFNNGIVMTNRTLRTNELFQVRLDLVIPKWAGSIEIGVTQHSANEIPLPFSINSAKSGTWAMTGEDVIRDGTIIIPQYVRNLNRLVEGDTVGVVRKDMGILHFLVNGVDQGPAAFNIPEHVFGIIDLYGRVAQATIMDAYMPPPPMYSPESPLSTESNATIYPEMCFHRVHGRNARLSRNRLTASRATVYSEFNDAVLFSCRPLRECDMFELRIDKMVDCWIGSLEIGVTAIHPDDLEANGGVGAVAGTATDLSWDTYILSGAAMMKDGECVRSGYPLDLDMLTVGSRVGMMWHADRSLHYYLDGMDMGKAWYVPHLNIYAVVDLYGQCTQVSILQNEERAFNYNGCTNSDHSILSNSRALSSPPPPYWSFSEYCGDNICMMHDYSIARRFTPDPMAALVFSSAHLATNEVFEIEVTECKFGYAGSFRMGITDINILNAHVNRSLPPTAFCLPHCTTFIDGSFIKSSKPGSRSHDLKAFIPSFEWLRPGDRVGFKKTTGSRVLIYVNSELLDIAFESVPDKVYVVIELSGQVTKIQAVTRGPNVATLHHTSKCIYYFRHVGHFSDREETLNSRDRHAQIHYTCGTVQNDACYKTLISNIPSSTHTVVPVTMPNRREDCGEETDQKALEVAGKDAGNPVFVGEGTSTIASSESQTRRRPTLPYTFHYLHGNNIKLCSSDTVAIRVAGYQDAISVVSQPIRRGHNFRFRVDKVNPYWSGTVSIGAVGNLTSEPLPNEALKLKTPCWVITSEILNNNGRFYTTLRGLPLEAIEEQSVLTLHFRFTSELLLEVDGRLLGAIATIPRNLSHVYPMIELYGKVTQVSVLLHPHVVASGTSLDLPIITENLYEECLAELELDEDECLSLGQLSAFEAKAKNKAKEFNQDNLVEECDSSFPQPGTSTSANRIPQTRPSENEIKNNELKSSNVPHPSHLTLHQSLILSGNTADNSSMSNPCIQKSHSSHHFLQVAGNVTLENEVKETLRLLFSAGSRGDTDAHEDFCDTNIRHNDRYPEASDVDNLDNEIMDALALETGNLPDLTEEQSSSIDESTRRDDLWSETLPVEYLAYLNLILFMDQDWSEGHVLEAAGERCEHLRLVLKYWQFMTLPFPELRQAVVWGQLRCYCHSCSPGPNPFAGWVRIERSAEPAGARRSYWHLPRSALGHAHGLHSVPRRPRSLAPKPTYQPSLADIWFDEEDKPHHVALAIELEVEGSDPENDRLVAILINVMSHVPAVEDNPPSLEE